MDESFLRLLRRQRNTMYWLGVVTGFVLGAGSAAIVAMEVVQHGVR